MHQKKDGSGNWPISNFLETVKVKILRNEHQVISVALWGLQQKPCMFVLVACLKGIQCGPKA
jgi:hypothetical protein